MSVSSWFGRAYTAAAFVCAFSTISTAPANAAPTTPADPNHVCRWGGFIAADGHVVCYGDSGDRYWPNLAAPNSRPAPPPNLGPNLGPWPNLGRPYYSDGWSGFAERKIRLSLIGGGAYLYGIDVNSSSGFYSGSTQGGAVGTLWGGSVFLDIMRVPVPLLGSPMLSVGVVADQTNAQLQFNGSCGGDPCTGTNGSVRETAVIGEVNLAWPLGGGNVYNWYAGGGAVFKKPLGNPTGPGGPGIDGSATAPAVRIGGTLMHNFTDNFAAGVKVGFQWAGSTTYDTTLPGERFRFGQETEMIFAAVATYSIPVGGPAGP